MTVTTPQSAELPKQLEARNREVYRAYLQIIQATKPFLTAFDSKKYRTCINVNHAESGKDTNLIYEFICHFWNLTLTENVAGYRMLYVTYDQESIKRFGARLYNRILRQVFKQTMKTSIEDCVRVNNPGNVQQFFLNRIANGENDYISIEIVEQTNAD
jgi:hypothetical protein